MTTPDLPADALLATCDACNRPIAHDGNGPGHLWIDHEVVSKVERLVREWRARRSPDGVMTMDELMSMPDVAPWRIHHAACDPEPEANSYVIELHRLQNGRQLLAWTAHLIGKQWVRSTDWLQLIEGAAEGTGRRLRAVEGVAL